MSNKLKTLSASQIEQFLEDSVNEYIQEDCNCSVNNLSTPRFDQEDEEAGNPTYDLTFEVRLSYQPDSK